MLLDLETDSLHMINAMAEFVWRMCDGLHSIDEMEQRIAEAYDVPEGTDVRTDLESVIQSFADRGVLADQET